MISCRAISITKTLKLFCGLKLKRDVFLSFTDARNEIRASLRFKQNWDNDYRRSSSTKYKIFTAEVEKAVNRIAVAL